MRMRKTLLAALAVLPLAAAPAFAGSDGFPVVPIEYDPGHLGTITAQWETHVGLPDAGNSDHALHLEKRGMLTDNAAAFAELKNVEGTTTPETISFWIPAEDPDQEDDYCNNGSPRWNIVTADGLTHFAGCAFGEATGTETDRRGREWTKLTWRTSDPSQVMPPIAAGDPVAAVYLVADEPGSTYIDNINFVYTMGKPGKGDGSTTGEDDA
jgi:hypothetical protein